MSETENPEETVNHKAPPEDTVRRLAELIWESEGRPDGSAERHWRAAQSILASRLPFGEIKLSAVDILQFKSDLAEVQLLLDYISGNPNFGFVRTSPPGQAPEALSKPPQGATNQADALWQAIANSQITSSELIQVSTIRFPPDKTPIANAVDAAFLIAFRDKLNLLVRPASGLTVAFTLLIWTPAKLFWQRKDPGANSKWARWALANQAYPRLNRSILWFRFSTVCLPLLALFVIAASIWCSQEVAEGQARVNRAVALEQQLSVLTARLEQLENVALAPDSPPVPTNAAGDHGDEAAATAAEPTLASLFCPPAQPKSGTPQMGALSVPTPDFAEKYETCYEIQGVQSELLIAKLQLKNWWIELDQEREIWQDIKSFFSPVADTSANNPTSPASADNAHQPVTAQALPNDALPISRLSEITSIWSPALYGLVGAVVAALRSIYTKVSTCTLAPWDTRLMWTRLLLGAMAGTFIGLFFSPSGTTVEGTPGVGTLSLSAIAFLAGYAVDKLFELLDNIIGRLFGSEQPANTTNIQAANPNVKAKTKQ